MGRVKQVVIGDIEAEEKNRAKAAVKREQKKIREGEKPAEETENVDEVKKTEVKVKKVPQSKKSGSAGKNYQTALQKVDKNKSYSPIEALKLIKEVAYANFNETVELHINVKEKGIRGSVSLPHGTGKEVRVKIADEALVSSLEKGGKIDFDILVATPDMMPKLAKVAKILGPRGLMPNPKTGTIGPHPEAIALSLSKGLVQYKTESDFPIIHTIIGKINFEEPKIIANYEALIKAVGKDKIVSLFLKSTMSPSVKLSL